MCNGADVNILPFAGYRYAAGGDVSALVAPPYDQISPETRERLYAMSPENVVRVTFPRDEPDKYGGARRTLDRWIADGVFVREDRPAIYPYHQTYRVGGETVTRTGFIALGEVTDYGERVVLPHERTHAGPKKDRLELMEATDADTGLIFMLVGDPLGDLRQATRPAGEPVAEAVDLKGERHRLWKITDTAAVSRIQSLMAPRQVIIADGHHRYETAVEYARRRPGASHKMMAFFTLEAPGLTIFPNHRLVHGVRGFDFRTLLDGARRWFDVRDLRDPLGFRPTPTSIGIVAGTDAAVFTPRPDARIDWPAGTSPAWRRLAVAILHEGVLRPLLGITDEMLDAKTHVDYTADQVEAVELARAGRYQTAFLIAPTTPEELQSVVRGGELLPQKSTHFYPKLLDGLVFHLLG
jgi:uncharacterized protein (DUF1015 family)